MKKLVIFGGLILILGWLFVSTPIQTQAIKFFSFNPCDTPISYKIGQIDAGFNLSQKQVIADTKEAAGLLSQAEGKNLFVYNPSAPLTINFIYDQRSALNSTINNLQSKLETQNKSLQQQFDDYEKDVKDFEAKLADLNATVEKYNSEGGAPPDAYNDLINRQNELRAEGAALNQRARQLNLQTKDYNGGVHTLNRDVDTFNNAISVKPEEGLFDPQADTITIYFANSHNELVHTLAHEFGHALGMQHVSDPEAIMYPNSTPALAVTQADQEQMDRICSNQSAMTSLAIHLNQELQYFQQALLSR